MWISFLSPNLIYVHWYGVRSTGRDLDPGGRLFLRFKWPYRFAWFFHARYWYHRFGSFLGMKSFGFCVISVFGEVDEFSGIGSSSPRFREHCQAENLDFLSSFSPLTICCLWVRTNVTCGSDLIPLDYDMDGADELNHEDWTSWYPMWNTPTGDSGRKPSPASTTRSARNGLEFPIEWRSYDTPGVLFPEMYWGTEGGHTMVSDGRDVVV